MPVWVPYSPPGFASYYFEDVFLVLRENFVFFHIRNRVFYLCQVAIQNPHLSGRNLRICRPNEMFDICHIGYPRKQRAKAAEVSKFGKAVSNCCT